MVTNRAKVSFKTQYDVQNTACGDVQTHVYVLEVVTLLFIAIGSIKSHTPAASSVFLK